MIILATRPRDAIKNGCEQCPSFFVFGGWRGTPKHILLLFFLKDKPRQTIENKKIINWTDGMAFEMEKYFQKYNELASCFSSLSCAFFFNVLDCAIHTFCSIL